MKAHHNCPVQATINVLSGKWKVQAVWHLSFGPRRFAELRDLLRGVSEKVLAAQLRELEKDGVVNRMALRSSPPKVTYSLSRSGRTLIRSSKIFATGAPNSLGSRQICHGIPEQ
jgi:DNA-binding HxlR family transcriptional regulator